MRFQYRYVAVMRRPWLDWSRPRFAWTLLSAVVVLFSARWVLAGAIDSTAVTAIVLVVYIAGGLVVMYVTFSWAKEYDRRNPRR